MAQNRGEVKGLPLDDEAGPRRHSYLIVTEFWGGSKVGQAWQLTMGMEYIHLDRDGLRELARIVRECLHKERA